MHLAALFGTQLLQITFVAGFVFVLTRTVTRGHAHLSYVLWLVVLVKCVTPPIWSSPVGAISWCHLSRWNLGEVSGNRVSIDIAPSLDGFRVATDAPHQSSTAIDFDLAEPMHDAAPNTESIHNDTNAPNPTSTSLSIAEWRSNEPAASVPADGSPMRSLFVWLGLGWLGVSLCVFLATCCRAAVFLGRLRASEVEHTDLADLTYHLSRKVGLRRTPRLVVTSSSIGPAVIGLFRPLVVIPKLISERCPKEELEPILAHELIHIRRGDLWASLLRHVVASLWWFHPLLWKVSNEVRCSSERCCDEEVIACLRVSPKTYARTLVHVLELKKDLRAVPLVPGVRAVDITSERMERIMSLRHGSRQRTPRWCWGAALLLAIFSLPGAATIHGGEQSVVNSLPIIEKTELHAPRRRQTLVHLECHFLSASSHEIDTLPVTWQAMPPSRARSDSGRQRTLGETATPTWGEGRFTVEKKLPTFYALLSDVDVASVMAAVKKENHKIKSLGRPAITTQHGIVASCQVVKSRPFVAGVSDGEPVVEQIDVGLSALLRPSILKDGVQLRYQLESTQIRTIDRVELRQDSGKAIRVEVPVIANSRVAGESLVPEGKTLLVRMRACKSDARTHLLLAFIKPIKTTLNQRILEEADGDSDVSANRLGPSTSTDNAPTPQEDTAPRVASLVEATSVPRKGSKESLEHRERWQLSLSDCIRLGLSNTQRSVRIQLSMPSAQTVEETLSGEWTARHAHRGLVSTPIILQPRLDSNSTSYDAEISVRNYLFELTRAYWELFFHYHDLDAVRTGHAGAEAMLEALRGLHTSDEAQARSQYFTYRARLDQVRSDVLHQEARLRYLMGLSANDGQQILPTDKPTKACVSFDWQQIKAESLEKRPELRRARWKERQIEHELTVAKQQLLPELDAISLYRLLGLSDELGNADSTRAVDDPIDVDDLLELQSSFQFANRTGFRKGLTAVRNLQSQQQRQQTRLSEMELEVTHQLSSAVRRLRDSYQFARTQYNALIAHRDQAKSAMKAFASQSVPLDLVLDAQSRQSQSERDYFRALVAYQLAIAEVHFRKGTLLPLLNCMFAKKADVDRALADFDQHHRSTEGEKRN